MTQAQNLADLSQAYTAGALGWRNRIVNGDMRVWQRSNNALIGINNPMYAAVDRFYYYTVGATAQAVAGWQTPSGRLATRMVANAAGNTGMAMGQRIEQANCWDLDNQLITVTAWVASEGNASPAYGCNAFVWSSADNPSGGGAWVSGTQAPEVIATSGQWSYIRNRIQLPANAHNGFAVEFGFPGVASGKANALGDVQVERGYVATPFEQRPISAEIALCQRYLEAISVNGIMVYNQATGTAIMDVVFQAIKRAGVTFSYTGAMPSPENTCTPTAVVQDRSQAGRSQLVWTGNPGALGAGTCGRMLVGGTMWFSSEL